MSSFKSARSEQSASTSVKVTINDEALLTNPDILRELGSRGEEPEAITSETTLLPSKGKNGYGTNDEVHLNRSITVVEQQLEKKFPGNGSNKMETFDGVFVPTFLNVLSILMFLRFGFVLGQTGILGMILLLLVSYGINLLTTLSISAISTNGTVRGGGAYYMISRSLGPEFGGSIGVVFYIGQVLNSGMNVVGFCEPMISNFGKDSGAISHFFPEGRWWLFCYSTILLALCTGVCAVGSSLFARSSRILFYILTISTISIPISTLFVQPYIDSRFDEVYTGLSWATLKDNFFPRFTSGAAGSQLPGKENFQDMFGIFFPATAGIFAGASMSGDLKEPSKSIPKGTLWGLLTTFICYCLVILSIGATASRELLYKDLEIIRNSSISPYIIIMGEFSTSLFSALMGVIGAAKLLQAIARDNLLPYTSWFSKGYTDGDNPLPAILFTYILTQITLLFDINQIAVFITMAYLTTFVVTNLACFLLKIASAPNFRPSFKYFNSTSAGVGAFVCVVSMFLADGISASGMICVLTMLFLMIHYISPPKPWGDVSQTLIYHQVRKYLLRLRQDHVKFWRPQILLLVDDPRTSWSLIHFCNHLKKGGLYILGHVMVTQDFTQSYPEMKKQQNSWLKLRDVGNIKGFVQIGAGPNVVWGARNVYLGSGLGGMKPNITVMGFFEIKNHYPKHKSNRSQDHNINVPIDEFIQVENLPTDSCRKEPSIQVTEWVHIVEDLLTMQANIAIAKGFPRLEFPTKESLGASLSDTKGYIDLYPIQMSAQIVDENGEMSALSTNFDTYTLILQLGAILHTVPVWKKNHILRVVVFVEFGEDVESEKLRIKVLLEKLRINAEVLVLCLSCGNFGAYETILHGKPDISGRVNKLLGDDEWWKETQEARSNHSTSNTNYISSQLKDEAVITENAEELRKLIDNAKNRRPTYSSLQRLGVSFSMTTNNLLDQSKDTFESDSSDSEEDDQEYDQQQQQQQQQEEEDVTLRQRPSRLFIRRSSTGAMLAQSPKSSTNSTIPTIPTTVAAKQIAAAALSAKQTNSPLIKSTSNSTKAKSLRPHFLGNTMPDTRVVEEAEAGRPTIMFDETSTCPSSARPSRPSSIRSGKQGPNTRITFDEGTFQKSPLSSISKPISTSISGGDGGGGSSSNFSTSPLTSEQMSPIEDENQLSSFNDLPAKAQHVVLNDMMNQISKDSVVIFSTLPAPTPGTHKSEAESLEYVESLELWCEDLPPMILLHSQSMTVTTAL